MTGDVREQPGVILIIDDSNDDVELLKRSLGDAGLKNPISVVHSGQEALSLLTKEVETATLPSVIFLDLKLPDVSGFDVMRWIAKEPTMRNSLVVIHSGIAGPSEIDALYKAGANTFLHKAGDPEELKNLVKAFAGHFGVRALTKLAS